MQQRKGGACRARHPSARAHAGRGVQPRSAPKLLRRHAQQQRHCHRLPLQGHGPGRGHELHVTALVNLGNTNNANKAAITPAFMGQFPGLNTQGLDATHIDFTMGSLNPPHTHLRALELLLVLKGKLYVGFVSTNGATNTLFATTIKSRLLFMFLQSLVHFKLNVGNGPAIAFTALNSQNSNAQANASALFKSMPPIED